MTKAMFQLSPSQYNVITRLISNNMVTIDVLEPLMSDDLPTYQAHATHIAEADELVAIGLMQDVSRLNRYQDPTARPKRTYSLTEDCIMLFTAMPDDKNLVN